MSDKAQMTNYADAIDALSAQDHEPQTELARTRLELVDARRVNRELLASIEPLQIALAEAHRLNRELVEALDKLVERIYDTSSDCPYSVRQLADEAFAVLEKGKP